MTEQELMCEVCNKEKAVGVACVPAIPYSAAYGRNCLEKDANPYQIIRANVACVGGPDNCAKWFLEQMTFVDDNYISLREALEKYPMTIEEINL